MEFLGRSKTTSNNYKEGPTSDKPCRSCVDFQTWAKQQNETYVDVNKSENNQAKSTSQLRREDCPLDKDQLGRYTWGLLHTMAAHYPELPTQQERRNITQFFSLFSKLYPCEHCAKDFQQELKVYPPVTTSQEDLSQWLCRVHNIVNEKLGKPKFDCSLVNQRWRDGWNDGSCD